MAETSLLSRNWDTNFHGVGATHQAAIDTLVEKVEEVQDLEERG